jgi:tellurium resistance protein TerD
MSISSGQKGFGLGKAAVGAILLGPVGLLGGMLDRKKIELVCQSCGHRAYSNSHPLRRRLPGGCN